MFTKVSFQNLRCFKDFTLENLTPLTLISGRNNVGKTTVLEGIFLLLSYHGANVFLLMNHWRGIGQFEDYLYPWDSYFFDMDATTVQLNVSATDDSGMTHSVSLLKESKLSLAPFSSEGETQSFPQGVASAGYALKVIHKCLPEFDSEEAGHFSLTPAGVKLEFDNPLHLPLPPQGIYLGSNARVTSQVVAERLGYIEMKNKKEQLVKNLRFLHEEISDVFSVPTPGKLTVYSRLNSGKTLPVRAMGDGINKLLHYLSAMIANPGRVFLLDEIETGFHHSFYSKMWELIARVANETGSQVFATTHSYECISAAHDGVSDVDPALLTYVRLGKEGESIVPHYFSGDDLAFVLEREMEVR